MSFSIFGDGGAKTSASTDARVGASDNAIVLQSGAFLFNPGQKAANTTAAATGTNSDAVQLAILIAAVGLVGLALISFWRKV